jgi:hypothetical protein
MDYLFVRWRIARADATMGGTGATRLPGGAAIRASPPSTLAEEEFPCGIH